MKTIALFVIIATFTIIIVHKGWHEDIYRFADGHQEDATKVVNVTKTLVHNITTK